MRRIPLGSTDVTITDYCLGTMTWGTQTPEDDAHARSMHGARCRDQLHGHRRDVPGQSGGGPKPWA
jgi:hypothetical protein